MKCLQKKTDESNVFIFLLDLKRNSRVNLKQICRLYLQNQFFKYFTNFLIP